MAGHGLLRTNEGQAVPPLLAAPGYGVISLSLLLMRFPIGRPRSDQAFTAVLSLLIAACVQPGIGGVPTIQAHENHESTATYLPVDSGPRGVTATTAAHPAISLDRLQLNLMRSRLSLHPVTGAAPPVAPANPEPPAGQHGGAGR